MYVQTHVCICMYVMYVMCVCVCVLYTHSGTQHATCTRYTHTDGTWDPHTCCMFNTNTVVL